VTTFVEDEGKVLEDESEILNDLLLGHPRFDLHTDIRTVDRFSERDRELWGGVACRTFVDSGNREEGVVEVTQRGDVLLGSEGFQVLGGDIGES
jgi:hypothetical protein